MRAFSCPVCERLVTFRSSRCLYCGSRVGFDPASGEMAHAGGTGGLADRRCSNAAIAACNWLVTEAPGLCGSCLLTRTRPADGDADGLSGLAAAETAKRWLLFELHELGLPVTSWRERAGGLGFDLLSSTAEPVTTGHAEGIITLDLDETDPAHRERMRLRLGEPYRTVLGHFRHEIGHYFQPILLAGDAGLEERSRELFGDERADYQEALDRHYSGGPPDGWEQRFVSAYATMHPWEDWAETFAHYLHMRDTLQTAAAYRVRVDGPVIPVTDTAPLQSRPDDRPDDIHDLLSEWVPLTLALNAISRSMGESDLYPFVLTPQIDAKLAFIDELVRERSSAVAASPAEHA